MGSSKTHKKHVLAVTVDNGMDFKSGGTTAYPAVVHIALGGRDGSSVLKNLVFRNVKKTFGFPVSFNLIKNQA